MRKILFALTVLAGLAASAHAQNYYVNRLGPTTVITPLGPPPMQMQPMAPMQMPDMSGGLNPPMQMQPMQPMQLPQQPTFIFGR